MRIIFQINIDKGMPSNHRFTFYGEGDHDPGKEPGDVVIQLQEKEHPNFQRHGTDLSMRLDISLSESLCGFRHPIATLDDRVVLVATKPGEIIKHGAIKMIPGEGFPTHRDPFNKGRLIIVFNVVFPESLTEAAAKKIAQALPKVPNKNCPDDAEKVSMLEFDGKGQWKGGMEEGAANGEDEDEDDEDQHHYHHNGGGGGPQCAQQ